MTSLTITTQILICFVATFTLVTAALLFQAFWLPRALISGARLLRWCKTWSKSQLWFTVTMVLIACACAWALLLVKR